MARSYKRTEEVPVITQRKWVTLGVGKDITAQTTLLGPSDWKRLYTDEFPATGEVTIQRMKGVFAVYNGSGGTGQVTALFTAGTAPWAFRNDLTIASMAVAHSFTQSQEALEVQMDIGAQRRLAENAIENIGNNAYSIRLPNLTIAKNTSSGSFSVRVEIVLSVLCGIR